MDLIHKSELRYRVYFLQPNHSKRRKMIKICSRMPTQRREFCPSLKKSDLVTIWEVILSTFKKKNTNCQENELVSNIFYRVLQSQKKKKLTSIHFTNKLFNFKRWSAPEQSGSTDKVFEKSLFTKLLRNNLACSGSFLLQP